MCQCERCITKRINIHLTTDKIQVWNNGIMLTLINKEEAINKILNEPRHWGIISCQAIGYRD